MQDASTPAADPSTSSSAAADVAAQPASVSASSAVGGPLPKTSEELLNVLADVVSGHASKLGETSANLARLAESHDGQAQEITTLDQRLTAVQAALAEPQNLAAVETVLAALTKPGNRTTEFWLNLIGAVGVLALAAGGIIPGPTAAWVTLGGTALYTLARFLLKGKAADLLSQTLPLIAALLCLASLTGCTWIKAHQPQLTATASVIGQRALIVAEQTLLSAAVSEADSGFKADYLDAISSGLRANETNIVTSDDVAKIVTIWSPNDGSHWQALASGLAHVTDQALTISGQNKAATIVEQLATGLNAAAANARAASTTGTSAAN